MKTFQLLVLVCASGLVGCAHNGKVVKAQFSRPSPSDLYICGFTTEADKDAGDLWCMPVETLDRKAYQPSGITL